MPKLLERRIGTLSEFCEVTCELGVASARRRLWFRGVHDSRHALVPRLYRSGSDVAELLALEQDMLAEFRSRSRSLVTTEAVSDWEHMFVMQHYGVPTRLLDWSENAMFALYFALSVSAERGYPTDAAVWVLDPAAWNSEVVPGMESPGKALCIGDADLGDYGPGLELDRMAERAAAMWGLYNNPRIAAQRGVFTVFGRDKSPLDRVFEAGDFPDATLCRLLLPQEALDRINDDLRLLGFRESMIYPDLGGLATEIRVEHGLA
jgi:FRG domain